MTRNSLKVDSMPFMLECCDTLLSKRLCLSTVFSEINLPTPQLQETQNRNYIMTLLFVYLFWLGLFRQLKIYVGDSNRVVDCCYRMRQTFNSANSNYCIRNT